MMDTPENNDKPTTLGPAFSESRTIVLSELPEGEKDQFIRFLAENHCAVSRLQRECRWRQFDFESPQYNRIWDYCYETKRSSQRQRTLLNE